MTGSGPCRRSYRSGPRERGRSANGSGPLDGGPPRAATGLAIGCPLADAGQISAGGGDGTRGAATVTASTYPPRFNSSPSLSRAWLPGPIGRPFRMIGFFVLLSVMTKPWAWKEIVAWVREMYRSGSGSTSVLASPRPSVPPASLNRANIPWSAGRPRKETTRITSTMPTLPDQATQVRRISSALAFGVTRSGHACAPIVLHPSPLGPQRSGPRELYLPDGANFRPDLGICSFPPGMIRTLMVHGAERRPI
jgi:hypothetical protein